MRPWNKLGSGYELKIKEGANEKKIENMLDAKMENVMQDKEKEELLQFEVQIINLRG